MSQLAAIAKNELDVVRWLIVLIQFWNANAVIEDGQGELAIFDGKRQKQISRTSVNRIVNQFTDAMLKGDSLVLETLQRTFGIDDLHTALFTHSTASCLEVGID